jgi:hypothetical protein
MTSHETPSTAPRRWSKGAKMIDNYDVENQGLPDPCPTVTTCLMEKPEIDKKVKVSAKDKFLSFTVSNTMVTSAVLHKLFCGSKVCFCVWYGSEDKQRLFLYTALTDRVV